MSRPLSSDLPLHVLHGLVVDLERAVKGALRARTEEEEEEADRELARTVKHLESIRAGHARELATHYRETEAGEPIGEPIERVVGVPRWMCRGAWSVTVTVRLPAGELDFTMVVSAPLDERGWSVRALRAPLRTDPVALAVAKREAVLAVSEFLSPPGDA